MLLSHPEALRPGRVDGRGKPVMAEPHRDVSLRTASARGRLISLLRFQRNGLQPRDAVGIAQQLPLVGDNRAAFEAVPRAAR